MDEYYRIERGQALAQLGADPQQGLTSSQVEDRLRTHGPNVLVERGLKSPWRIVWEQLTAVMVVILIAAAVVSLALGDYKDAIVIGAIVVINTILGF